MEDKYKEKKKYIFFLLLGLLLSLGSKPLWAAEEDPLISLSYFNQQIEILKKELTSSGQEPGFSSELQIVTVKEGAKLVGAQGTEMILRSGKAKAIGSDLGGISDVTKGEDIGHGKNIEANHQLIIPRSDGRGLKAQSEAIVLVKGSYSVLEGR